MTLTIAALLKSQSTKYDNSDPAWAQYVDDHKEYLSANATLRPISEDLMNIMEYDMPRYLEYINYPSEISWIVFLINDIAGNQEFSRRATLKVPTMEQLNMLYEQYRTASSAR